MIEDSKAAAMAKEVKDEANAVVVGVEATPERTKEELTGEATAEGARGDLTGDSVPTVAQLFALSEKGAGELDDRWRLFQLRLIQETRGIKWTAAMPDLAPRICELLDIRIPDVLVGAWKKAKEVHTQLEESKKTPEKIVYLELAQHTIDYQSKPFIDVRIKSATVKKIEIAVQLGFNLKGFVLKIQNGGIKEIQTGHCEAKGTIKYGNLTIAEKKLEPIKLPFTVPIDGNDEQEILTQESDKKQPPEASAPIERIEM